MKHPHTEVLIAISENRTVQYIMRGGYSWCDMHLSSHVNPIMDYTLQWRVKPVEPVYEWQWLLSRDRDGFFVTSYTYLTEGKAKNEYREEGYTIHERIEASKREVK